MTQDLNEEDLDDNALHEAVRIGDVEAVQRALKDGWSYLHFSSVLKETTLYYCFFVNISCYLC